MKNLFFIAICTLLLSSCNGVVKATYPEEGKYGQNLLHGSDNLVIGLGDYSLSAKKGIKGTLTIELVLLHGDVWFYELGTDDEWSISSAEGNPLTQSFIMDKAGTSDVKFHLPWGSGRIRVDYYEDGNSTPTRSKIIDWG